MGKEYAKIVGKGKAGAVLAAGAAIGLAIMGGIGAGLGALVGKVVDINSNKKAE